MPLELRFSEEDEQMIQQLMTEFDPAPVVSFVVKDMALPEEDVERFIAYERWELRQQLDVAVTVGNVFEHIGYPSPLLRAPGEAWAKEPAIRLKFFYSLAQELTRRAGSLEDFEVWARVGEAVESEVGDALSGVLSERLEIACKRALRVHRSPQRMALL